MGSGGMFHEESQHEVNFGKSTNPIQIEKKNQKVKLSEMSIKFLVAMGKVHALQSVAHHLGANFFPKESGNYRSYESRYMRMRTIEVFNALRK